MGLEQTRGWRRSRRQAQGRERKDRLVDTPPRPSCAWWGHLDPERQSSLLRLSTTLSTPQHVPFVHPSKWWLWLPAGCLGEGHQEGRHREEAMTIIKADDRLLLVGILVFSSCGNKKYHKPGSFYYRNVLSHRPGG